MCGGLEIEKKKVRVLAHDFWRVDCEFRGRRSSGKFWHRFRGRNLQEVRYSFCGTRGEFFRKVPYRFDGAAPSQGTDFVAGAALSQKPGTDFSSTLCKVEYRFPDRRSTFATSSTVLMALSETR